MYLAVKNFEQFQHYRNRNPVWIKLYTSLLDDYEFLVLPEATQRHLLMIWLVASRSRNRLPADPRMLAQAIKAQGKVDVSALVHSGFLEYREDDSVELPRPASKTPEIHASTTLEESAIPEGEGDREGEKEREQKRTSSSSPARLALLEKWPNSYRNDLTTLLDRVPDEFAWIAEINVTPHGIHGVALSFEQIGPVIRDYNANGAEPNLRLFRGYMRDAARPKEDRRPKSRPASAGDRQAAIIAGIAGGSR